MKRSNNNKNVINSCNCSFATLYLKGEFYNTKTHVEPPFEAQPFTMPDQQGYMLSVGLSEFTLNSASYALYSAGVFQAVINDSMVSRPERVNGCIQDKSREKMSVAKMCFFTVTDSSGLTCAPKYQLNGALRS